jgi:histidyl-tRNA synthetase
MAASTFQTLPGFRDFPPRECAIRNYLTETWRAVARQHGFVEYETPLLEDTALYLKKSGGELSTQLFRFRDQGQRDVTLRPEVTASLARLAAAQQRGFPKPLKWFEIGPCFRYEKPQKGRGREFIQFNADILGEAAVAADAELIALAIETMLALGFREGDFLVRISDRRAWVEFATRRGITGERVNDFLQIVDKIEREPADQVAGRLVPFGIALTELQAFAADPANASPDFVELHADLTARGLDQHVAIDLTIVRGLAYYTGLVFEVFDGGRAMRSIAGGGRYDRLVATITDGATDLPATGFAMGDHVIGNLIEETPHAKMQMEVWLQSATSACDVFVVIADEARRGEALGAVTRLRASGVATDFPLTPAKVAKQFQRAEQSGARFALVIGAEFPALRLKVLASRTEEYGHADSLVEWLHGRLHEPDGPLLA